MMGEKVMANVGILSMQRVINYGSFLQAYGLKTMLEEMGHDVQFVDYRVGEVLIETEGSKKNGLIGKINKAFEVLKYDAPLKHKFQFILYKKQFAKKYHQILGLTKEQNYTSEVDILVIGSDEVFNCVQKNPNVGYSLELFGKYNRARTLITYAASFGNTTIEKLEQYEKTEEIGELLKKFNAISVRDENTAEIVRKLSGKKVEYHLDPVLVYDYVGKCKFFHGIEPKERFLVLYAYSERILEDESAWISSYAERQGLKVYAIGGVQKCADRFVDCSPFEVISYFMQAECVVTDTFHGTILSVITHKNFVSIVRRDGYGNAEKMIDLLGRLRLSDRILANINELPHLLDTPIDYQCTDNIIQRERKLSYEYLSAQL